MKLLNWLFKRKKTRELGLEELRQKIKEKQEQSTKQLGEQIKQVKQAREEVREALKDLKNPKLADEKDEKVIQRVLSNKNAYVMHTQNLIESLEVPSEAKISELIEFCKNSEEKFEEYSKKTMKNFQTAQYLIGEELVN
ncbi:hypothetical protein DRJ22_01195, partial [Candidatus Woesearchaeota archaeon]